MESLISILTPHHLYIYIFDIAIAIYYIIHMNVNGITMDCILFQFKSTWIMGTFICLSWHVELSVIYISSVLNLIHAIPWTLYFIFAIDFYKMHICGWKKSQWRKREEALKSNWKGTMDRTVDVTHICLKHFPHDFIYLSILLSSIRSSKE